METISKKWGNSLGIRLPKVMAEHLNINDGSLLELRLEKDYIKIIPIKKQKIKLKDLLSMVNKNNIHNDIETGPPIGNEVW
ncbi:AbrB/MazE/SpoVT family DNA-binding domain-containing protein [Bacteroidetes/Chlorobi group bacterium ChocPot_Mid]|jgi:antitoxin MazE|nr:MAG: AbrB/MazE/SpoVT family DNA-binding domain-containing protein [Bacteroidetes/Chlorobi group bacterium ChocPot_Mid]